MTPYYDDGQITLYCADHRSVLPSLEPVDITITSPPYNMGLSPGGNGRGLYTHTTSKGSRFSTEGYDGASDAMDPVEYDTWQRWMLGECWRLSRLAVFYNHRPRVIHGRVQLPLGFDFGPGLWPRQIITWDRTTGIDVNLRQFCTRGEWIVLFARDEFKLIDHAASGMGDVWRIPFETKVDHPAPFPVALPQRCIHASGARSVLDPCAGSGTTLRAALDSGIRGIGIEQSETFCALAVERLRQGALDFGGTA